MSLSGVHQSMVSDRATTAASDASAVARVAVVSEPKPWSRADGCILGRVNWQMALGERVAIEGLLAQLRPKLAIEIGTAQGGTLERIATYSDEVHTFDLGHEVERAQFPNVTFHEGDNHILLPQLLARFGGEGRNVDFVLVDGDHSGAGVRTDVEDLLASGAVRNTFILLHDTMNEGVLHGLNAVDLDERPEIAFVDLAFVRLSQRSPRPLDEAWGGLGLIVVDCDDATGVLPERRSLPAGPRAMLRRALWHAAAPLRAARREARVRAGRVLRRLSA